MCCEISKMNAYLLLCLSLLTFTIAATVSISQRIRRQSKLTYRPIECTMEDGKMGVCVPYFTCNATHVLPYGNIDDSELRQFRPNACAVGQWCCSLDLVDQVDAAQTTIAPVSPTSSSPSSSSSCKPLMSDRCPWCVTLHKVLDRSITDKEAFCIGSLISSNMILTAATCLIASEKFTLFARVPTSADKNTNYYETKRIYNPGYNSGTHFNDFGLIILEKDVDWGTTSVQNACLGFEEISGECLTFGLDKEDNIISTTIQPIQENCQELGGYDSLEAVCGNSSDISCFASYGAPVVCQAKNSEGGELVGVARSGCVTNQVLLGKLSGSKLWLNSLFSDLNKDIKTVTIV